MQHLSLRLRVFLFFCLIGLGTVTISILAAVLGYRQLGVPEAYSAFSTVVIVTGFGSIGLTLLVWLLFDENVSKSIEALAASLRVRTEGKIDKKIERDIAKYLGDLAPAASAMHHKLAQESQAKADAVARRTARLEAQMAQLLAILSDIPIAVIVARSDHQIVFYDGQAAELMEQECPARLNGSVFDYLDEDLIIQELDEMRQAGISASDLSARRTTSRVKELRRQFVVSMSDQRMDPQVVVAYNAQLNAYRRLREHLLNIAEVQAGEK